VLYFIITKYFFFFKKSKNASEKFSELQWILHIAPWKTFKIGLKKLAIYCIKVLVAACHFHLALYV
jgi:hypothetical protein